jgi:glycine cleavage system H protein
MAELKFPDDLFYAKSDEWVRIEGDTATIGISDYAQDALNDIVYVELPEVGDTLEAGDQFGSLESVKAASDLYTFVSGEVIAVNGDLEEEPEIINSDPYGKGWILKIKLSGTPNTDDLMDSGAYQAYCEDR